MQEFCRHAVMLLHVFPSCAQVHGSHTCCGLFVHQPAYVHSCLSTVWSRRSLPAVLTLVCVDSKHSCRSQRPRSGRTRGSEGQWRGEGRGARAGRQEMEGGTRIRREGVFFFILDTWKRKEFVVGGSVFGLSACIEDKQ